jgi:transcriptional antiterminator NusG
MNTETNTENLEDDEANLAEAVESEEIVDRPADERAVDEAEVLTQAGEPEENDAAEATADADAEESSIPEVAAEEVGADLETDADGAADEMPVEADDSAGMDRAEEVADDSAKTGGSAWISPSGKRLSLKERLASRRQEEQGQETSDLDGRWYVLHTYSGYENKVKKTIETRVDSLDLADRVYEVVVPTQEEIEIKSGQRQTVLKKVFPGYVLVRMTLDDETWYALRNTPGVTGFVNVDNKPVPLDESRVQLIMKGMTAEAPKVKVTFQVGDTVRINDGPFADFRGEIDEINQEKGKIRVMVSFFGRETPVELDFLQAERES